MEHISLTRYLPECANQSSGRDVTTFNFTTSISETDEYYLVFENPSNKDPNEMNLNLQINRSTYDVKDGLKKPCTNLSACDFSLGFLSTASVVYVSEEKTQFGIGNHVYCNPTWVVYFVFFGGIPMIVGFSISLVLFILFMHCPRAWEGVHRPKPWDDLPKKDQKPSILDTVPEDTSKGKKEKQSKTEVMLNPMGKYWAKNLATIPSLKRKQMKKVWLRYQVRAPLIIRCETCARYGWWTDSDNGDKRTRSNKWYNWSGGPRNTRVKWTYVNLHQLLAHFARHW